MLAAAEAVWPTTGRGNRARVRAGRPRDVQLRLLRALPEHSAEAYLLVLTELVETFGFIPDFVVADGGKGIRPAAGPITMPGDETVPGYEKHLYSDKAGIYRARLGAWEQHAHTVEAARPGFVGWYRNPTGGARALRVPYKTNSNSGWGKMYPDFIVLHQDDDDTIRASIIDPHGHHLADAGDKLRGLAAYAEKHGADYARIIGVIKMTDGTYRMLDLKDATIRAAVKEASGQEAIEQVFTQHGSTYS